MSLELQAAGAQPGLGAPGPAQQFVYSGRIGELYGIFIINLLLSIVTLGFYRFWGKTRMRRYIWSHTSLDGDALEYTGTGGELFIGFLIVVGLFFVASILRMVVELQSAPDSPLPIFTNLAFGLLIVYLVFVARYAAQRYRLTRTLWRGIRGGMTGSAWAWGFKAMLLGIVSAITLGLAGPWVQMRLLDDRMNNSYFGDAKASIRSSSAPLYVAFLIGFAILIVGTVVILIVMSVLLAASGLTTELATAFGQGANNEEAQRRMGEIFKEHVGLIVGAGIAFYVSMIFLSIIAFAQYYVAMAREVAAKLSLSELHFGTTVTAGRFIGFVFVNLFIWLFTLGLGLPVIIHLMMRFITNNIQIYGEIEASQIMQSNLHRPRYGEGLLEAFDPGLF